MGKTNRRWDGTTDEVVRAFSGQGLDTAKLFTVPKLVSPAQAERLGKEYKRVVKQTDPDTGEPVLTTKPPGKVSLADESDPRQEVDPASVASADFDAIEED
jgi:hypothetical protein